MTDPSRRKSDGYYRGERPDLLEWVGGSHERVLEVGCGAGGNASWFRSHGATRLVGVELDETSAAQAGRVMDEVYAESIETAVGRITERFDLIVCADVLEHLVDPWNVVASLGTLANEHGRLAVSIPNIRFYRALLRIAVGDGFKYDSDGIFDSTHIRFFARRNVRELLVDAGWMPVRWGNSPPTRFGRFRRALKWLTRGGSTEYLTYQWYVIASKSAADN